MRRRSGRPEAGFTLVEMLVVIVIIGILLSFILVAGFAGIRNAQVAATQGLITKLDVAVGDRMEALLGMRPDVLPGHTTLAVIAPGTSNLAGPQRAQVIARVDLVRAEMPDVFFFDASNSDYPINFAGQSFGTGANKDIVPIGATAPGAGIFGASYAARAAVNKLLGYSDAGTDGVDNDGNGLVDEVGETSTTLSLAEIQAKLSKHTHKTARSEVLYAMLVGGRSPLGSAFNKDDFTSLEVKDTDGDGLPEFIDSWGEPLQFFRWPTHFASDSQKGATPYGAGLTESRDQCPLDPNQQLMAPAWYSDPPSGTPPAYGQPGVNAVTFQNLFFSLIDPNFSTSPASPGLFWDRSGYYMRRAFATRPLIASSGPDRLSGIPRLGEGYSSSIALNAANLILIENQAAPYDPNRTAEPPTSQVTPAPSPALGLFQWSNNDATINSNLTEWAADDLTNHNLATPGGPR